jgi:hypothetical protein
MSRQFNYFALEKDERFICETLFKIFGELCVLPERAPAELMMPRRIAEPEEILLSQVGSYIALVPPELATAVHLREVPGNKYLVGLRESPVLQYLPSVFLDSATVKAGRIAYFYKGNLDMDAKVTKLFRALRQKSRKFPGSAVFWIFEQAAEEAKMLHYGVSDPEPNPLVAQKQ